MENIIDAWWGVELDRVRIDDFDDGVFSVFLVEFFAWTVIGELFFVRQPNFIVNFKAWVFASVSVGLPFLFLLCISHVRLREVKHLFELFNN